MFKEGAIENKRKKDLEKKQRLNALYLRNKFLGEWASTILGLNDNKKQKYINKVTSSKFKKDENKFVIKKIEKDFAKNKLARFKIPKNIYIVNEIPIGATGKIQRIGLAKKLGIE